MHVHVNTRVCAHGKDLPKARVPMSQPCPCSVGISLRAAGSFCLSLRTGDPLRSKFCPDRVSAQQMSWHCLAAGVAGDSDGPAVLCPR